MGDSELIERACDGTLVRRKRSHPSIRHRCTGLSSNRRGHYNDCTLYHVILF